MSGGWTPRAEETLVRRSTGMSDESVRAFQENLRGMHVSQATARRATLAAGQAALMVWEVERLTQEAPEAPA